MANTFNVFDEQIGALLDERLVDGQQRGGARARVYAGAPRLYDGEQLLLHVRP